MGRPETGPCTPTSPPPAAAPILDYAVAHPHVRLHVREVGMVAGALAAAARRNDCGVLPPHPPPPTPPAEMMSLFGIDPSRAVFGPISARIAHVPDGTPCGLPYSVSLVRGGGGGVGGRFSLLFTPKPHSGHQVVFREVLRGRLGVRSALDVWADGEALRQRLSRDTSSPPRAIRVRHEPPLHIVVAPCTISPTRLRVRRPRQPATTKRSTRASSTGMRSSGPLPSRSRRTPLQLCFR